VHEHVNVHVDDLGAVSERHVRQAKSGRGG
jgi:hypothetical protein